MQILAEAEDLPKTANIKTQLISLWTVPIFGGVLLIAFLAFPGFFPPMSPDMTADQVAAFYAEQQGDGLVHHDHLQHLRHHAAAVVHGDRGPDEADGDAEPRLRLLLSDRGGQRRDAVRARRHLLPGRRVPARPQSRTRDAAQRHGVDHLHRAGRRARRDEPAAGGRDLLRRRDPIRCSRGGSATTPWPPGWRWRRPSAPRSSEPARWRGTARCRSGCATARSRSSSL